MPRRLEDRAKFRETTHEAPVGETQSVYIGQKVRPYLSHPMSPKTHAQKVRRKHNLARRRSQTGSVIASHERIKSDTRLKSLLLYSFSFLVLALIFSLIILAIYVLIA